MPTRAIPERKARRAEWVMPGESFLREARRLMRIPAIPIKWRAKRILRASSMNKC